MHTYHTRVHTPCSKFWRGATHCVCVLLCALARQVGSIGWRAMLAALPVTMHIEAILHANNARDVEEVRAFILCLLLRCFGRTGHSSS